MLMNSSFVNVAPHRTLDPQESHCEHADAYRLLDRPVADGINRGVQIYPSDGVTRRTVTWDGMAAEIVQATRREKLEFRFHAAFHLLAIYDQGMRSDGDTFVEGLPRSRLRDVNLKLTLVPAGHEYHEWHEPRVLTRIVYFYFDPARMPSHSEAGVQPVPSVTDIGLTVGYSETSSFTAAFHKTTGVTPTAYRRTLT